MDDQFTRLRWVAGNESIDIMKTKHVAVFGCGGVGGYVIEGLVRSGIGTIDVFDHDTVDITNLNRQIIALHSTVGKKKVDIIKERTFDTFYLPENADTIDLSQYDYVIDAIDTVTAKIELIKRCTELNVPIISSMGTGNKLDPTHLQITDIYKTKIDPLAKVMRRELKARRIKKCLVAYSDEIPAKTGQRTPGSSVFVPASAGLMIAGYVFQSLIGG